MDDKQISKGEWKHPLWDRQMALCGKYAARLRLYYAFLKQKGLLEEFEIFCN